MNEKFRAKTVLMLSMAYCQKIYMTKAKIEARKKNNHYV